MSDGYTEVEWLGEIVRWMGLLWDVTDTADAPHGLMLVLEDHYGTGATASVLAEKVEVALQ